MFSGSFYRSNLYLWYLNNRTSNLPSDHYSLCVSVTPRSSRVRICPSKAEITQDECENRPVSILGTSFFLQTILQTSFLQKVVERIRCLGRKTPDFSYLKGVTGRGITVVALFDECICKCLPYIRTSSVDTKSTGDHSRSSVFGQSLHSSS